MVMRSHLFLILLFILFPVIGDGADPLTLSSEPVGRIRSAIDTYLSLRGGSDGELELVKLPAIPPIPTMTGEAEFEIVGPERIPPGGKVAVSLIVRQGGAVTRNIPLTLEVRHWALSLVPKRRIDRGEILSADDVEMRRVLQTRENHRLTDPREVVGRRATRQIQAGVAISPRDLEKVILVKTGQMVTIVAENRVIRLTAPGRAKGNGAAGETIVVQNVSSNRDLVARVIDEKTVRVDF